MSEPNFSMIFALPCIRDYHSPCTRVQYGRWIRVGIWFMNREQESTDPCLVNPEGWTFPLQSCDCSRWSQPASAAPRRRARTARRCTGLAAEVVSPDYQTSGGINSLKFIYWQGSLAASHQTSKKRWVGSKPWTRKRDKPQEHLVVLGGEGLAYRLVVWVQGHDLPPPDQVWNHQTTQCGAR